ncbi:related to SMI1-beta-1,3-glucan synthesis protein [Serendipita indica DSM 11827]|uniref:Related to SMI1-beta-1,3-glucan synthesis protein n=1 Tax=Serendipita indica (strain DSM 11827) TaxID=1109443 RepID=G4TI04_SERID|nr:related to SMI1-beta-1,3-glucan synthesis protein [Serendipita indica DSM 11827]
MSSTHDAFSIPNHSPTFPNRTLSPDRGGASNADYSYPPAQSSSPYSAGSFARAQRHEGTHSIAQDAPSDAYTGNSVLPVHSTHGAYSPLNQTWTRIESWLARRYPELGDTLNYGILPVDLHEIELQLGFALPQPIRDSYLRVDGQEAESSAGCTEGLFFGLSLLSLEEVVDEWKFWREVDDDPATGANPTLLGRMKSIPAGWIRNDYSNRGWIPLATDRVGNYLGVDVNPGEKGAPGQVIVFGRDFDTKVVLWRGDGEGGWAKWLAAFAEELENGDTFEVGAQDNNSEGSEDSIGHEPYFFDGSAQGNRGQGGGDGGAVGIRLNGEYRGWNVLEALADRSIKKWKEAGVVSEEEYPQAEPRRVSNLAGMQPIQQDSGIEVPIPLIGDEPMSALQTFQDKPLPSEPETPRARTHKATKSSVSRPAPRPIGLPTPSDIAVDVADSTFDESAVTAREDGDLERGIHHPLRTPDARSGSSQGKTPQTANFSPRMSEEDTRLLKRVSVEPPTPITTDTNGDMVTLPHQRRQSAPAEDLLEDDPPTALPMLVSPKGPGSPTANGQASPPGSVESEGTVLAK